MNRLLRKHLNRGNLGSVIDNRPALQRLKRRYKRPPRDAAAPASIRSFRDQHGLHDLIGDFPNARGRVRQKQGVGLVAFADRLSACRNIASP